MKRNAPTLVLGAGLCLAACGSHGPLLADRDRGEAEHLQAVCKSGHVVSDETKRADSLLAQAQKHFKDGDADPAATEAELSGTLYRLALSRKQLAETQAQVDALKLALAKDKDQLQTYQEILEEIKTVRKP